VVCVDVLKRRGGWPVHGLDAQLDNAPGPSEIREQLVAWRDHQRHARFTEPAPEDMDADVSNPVVPAPAVPDRLIQVVH
jgi:hypothetical protein